MTLPNIAESTSPEQRQAEQSKPPRAAPYQLRRNRVPRYRCGTCGSRNCSCVNLIKGRPPDQRLARGEDASAPALADTETFEDHAQHTIRSIQAEYQDIPRVHHIVTTIEKTYSSVGPGVIPPMETTLKAMQGTSPSDCPTYRFKEWTWHERSGLEFTLAAIIPPTPTIDGVWKKRTNRHESSNGTLYHRAEAMATIRCDFTSWRCVSSNDRMVATSHFSGRDIPSDSRNTIDLLRELAHTSGVR